MAFWRLFARNRSAVMGMIILILIFLMAISAPLFFPADPFSLAGQSMSPPGENGFLLGSDSLGRDVAAGIAHGAKTSLLIGLLATLVAVFIGVIMGALAGYYGGIVDNLLMRTTEMFQTIPSFLFAILLVAIMKPSIESIVIAIAVVSWPAVARLVRGEFLSLRNREFVLACHTLGMGDVRIMLGEILPNCLSPIIVIGSLMVATAILIESGLAFLGLGDPNIMSWGFQIGAGRTLLRSAWWVCTFPGIAILLTVLAINLVGEGLNDALNPRLRDRS
ncbi:ABC transporter permease [Pseudohalocynthiibacter aestuariivivens]|jgi:peptide/nickel transport system permease protein|uniref:ABC transporter permease n=1 Tax=Pseudohalocynthiibacter aestuariivivens TaxID=1591409 RepID=A0ABV5JJN3_9RHOB|nr:MULTISPECIES: ABC transporter permease [Pseudohalocynthiibacter]MBS9717546.1 ABC transporter permease [Pseudohalocynthiibacter aestuariivivens]MCK0102731.1 ABC transporter permease [Pseudohalocynthiibacter sp. F2068]